MRGVTSISNPNIMNYEGITLYKNGDINKYELFDWYDYKERELSLDIIMSELFTDYIRNIRGWITLIKQEVINKIVEHASNDLYININDVNSMFTDDNMKWALDADLDAMHEWTLILLHIVKFN